MQVYTLKKAPRIYFINQYDEKILIHFKLSINTHNNNLFNVAN